MKKAVVLLCAALALTGCVSAEPEIEQAMALRDKLLSGSGCSFCVNLTADYGDELYSFSMDCEADAMGNVEFCVTGPETIADITGAISETGGKLTFDETALQFDLMAEDSLSPVSAPWVLLKTLRSGYITSACTEEDKLHICIDDSFEDDALRLDIWLGEDSMPVRAEILHDGARILTLDIENFQIL